MAMLAGDDDFHCPVCNLPLRAHGFDGYGVLDYPNTREAADLAELSSKDQDLARKLAAATEWWQHANLLCDPTDEFGQLAAQDDAGGGPESAGPRSRSSSSRDIQEYLAECDADRADIFHRIEPDGERIPVVVTHDDGAPDPDEPVYIPIHSACLEMAKVAFKSSGSYVKDVRGLWTALRWRMKCRLPGTVLPPGPNYTIAEHGGYMTQCFLRDWEQPKVARKTMWPGPSEVPDINILHTFGSNPIGIYNLTESLVLNLQPIRKSSAARERVAGLRDRIMSLPNDVLNHITDAMGPLRELPCCTTGIMPQAYWQGLLKASPTSHSLLPWLWDVDTAIIDAKAAEPPHDGDDGFEWNWELLVRQLSRGVDLGLRPDFSGDSSPGKRAGDDALQCTGYHDYFTEVPAGLHNRRRIWQLLEEMFVGDRLPTSKRPDEDVVKLHWTKSGEMMNPPIALPSFNFDGFVRKIGGDVILVSGKRPMQYWQRVDGQYGNISEDTPPATVEEIKTVLRKLAYPV